MHTQQKMLTLHFTLDVRFNWCVSLVVLRCPFDDNIQSSARWAEEYNSSDSISRGRGAVMCQPLSSTAHNQLLHRSGSYRFHVMPVRMRVGVTARQKEWACVKDGDGEGLWGFYLQCSCWIKNPAHEIILLDAKGNVTEKILRATNDFLLNLNCAPILCTDQDQRQPPSN